MGALRCTYGGLVNRCRQQQHQACICYYCAARLVGEGEKTIKRVIFDRFSLAA